ncbi:unnamed protein product [Paramecium primaurelia]|uniref:Transmembrane protein n=1 Tax=Paramecium primaurelia TaxID=5886 RepID=A0A8S1PMQ0_PARPR|nr:unnamed protein product [Paramecium primaurelia]
MSRIISQIETIMIIIHQLFLWIWMIELQMKSKRINEQIINLTLLFQGWQMQLKIIVELVLKLQKKQLIQIQRIQENKWKKLTNQINSLLLLPQVVEQYQIILLRFWKTYLLNMQFRLNKCILNISFLGIIQQQSGYLQSCVNHSYDFKNIVCFNAGIINLCINPQIQRLVWIMLIILTQIIYSYTGQKRFSKINNNKLFSELCPYPIIHYIIPSYKLLATFTDQINQELNQKQAISKITISAYRLFQSTINSIHICASLVYRCKQNNQFFGYCDLTLQKMKIKHQTIPNLFQCLPQNLRNQHKLVYFFQMMLLYSINLKCLERNMKRQYQMNFIINKQGDYINLLFLKVDWFKSLTNYAKSA